MSSRLEFQSARYREVDPNKQGNERLKKMFELAESAGGGRLLDAGCLDGSFAELFIPKGFGVYGVDASPELRKAEKKGIKCVKADLEKGIPFRNEFFDVVVAGEIIEHLFDTGKFVSECRRVLKEGGKLIVSTPNTAAIGNRFRMLAGKKPFNLDYDKGGGHIRAYTLQLLCSQLRENGFTIKTKKADLLRLTDKFEPKILKKLAEAFADFFPSLSLNLIVEAEKAGAGGFAGKRGKK